MLTDREQKSFLAWMDNLPVMVAIASSSVRNGDSKAQSFPIQYVNATFLHSTGYSAEEVIGKDFCTLQVADFDQSNDLYLSSLSSHPNNKDDFPHSVFNWMKVKNIDGKAGAKKATKQDKDKIVSCLNNGESLNSELSSFHKNGFSFKTNLIMKPLLDADGNYSSMLIFQSKPNCQDLKIISVVETIICNLVLNSKLVLPTSHHRDITPMIACAE